MRSCGILLSLPVFAMGWVLASGGVLAEESTGAEAKPTPSIDSVLLERTEKSVERALAWLAERQEKDGRFPTLDKGQPAVTSLCVLAFLANGHVPGEGPYGDVVERGISFVLSCRRENGLLSYLEPEPYIAAVNVAYAANYNYPISALMLSEAYGMTKSDMSEQIRKTVEGAVKLSLKDQNIPKSPEVDQGGWRYKYPWPAGAALYNSDLSVTSWNLLFLRSAKNAGFEVPAEAIDGAVVFVKNCYRPELKTFSYRTTQIIPTRGMAGAGIVALSMSGYHDTEMARSAGDWLLRNPFDQYNGSANGMDRYHYGAFYASFGLFLLGDKYFVRFFPRLSETLMENQALDGSWAPEACAEGDGEFGRAYTTALIVLALSIPDQILPILQR